MPWIVTYKRKQERSLQNFPVKFKHCFKLW